jgi:hypothetical protein
MLQGRLTIRRTRKPRCQPGEGVVAEARRAARTPWPRPRAHSRRRWRSDGVGTATTSARWSTRRLGFVHWAMAGRSWYRLGSARRATNSGKRFARSCLRRGRHRRRLRPTIAGASVRHRRCARRPGPTVLAPHEQQRLPGRRRVGVGFRAATPFGSVDDVTSSACATRRCGGQRSDSSTGVVLAVSLPVVTSLRLRAPVRVAVVEHRLGDRPLVRAVDIDGEDVGVGAASGGSAPEDDLLAVR